MEKEDEKSILVRRLPAQSFLRGKFRKVSFKNAFLQLTMHFNLHKEKLLFLYGMACSKK